MPKFFRRRFVALVLCSWWISCLLGWMADPAHSIDPQAASRATVPTRGVPWVVPNPTESNATAPNPPRPNLNQPNLGDPGDQTAPPRLDIRPSGEPISSSLAAAMRQELENLIGRFESALLMANSTDQPAQLSARQVSGTLTASATPVAIGEVAPINPALQSAQQLIEDWSGLMTQRHYDTVRSRWLAARQALWDQFPLDRSVAQPEIRAIWLDRGTLVRARSRQGLANIFDQLSASGINTVFVETVNAGYPIYPSRVAPQQNPLTRSWDPLAAAVDLGKARQMEVHAWVWTFAAGNQAHNRLLNQPADYKGPVLNAHPTWANYDKRGETIPLGQTKPFLDPANAEARSYLLNLLKEIATRYDVDGIHLDYIRYPFQDPAANRTYGYGLASRQKFQQMTGVDPITLSPGDRALWSRWTQFRTQQVSSFVADASQMLKRERPNLIVSTAVFAQPTHERLQKLQQDWETWAKLGSVDWIVLMSYAADTQRFDELIRPWVIEANYGSTLVIPGIRLNTSRPVALDQIQSLRDLPAVGYALFAAEYLDQSFQSVFKATQGPSATLRSQPLPQRRPFTAAAHRYQTLRREWNWLLSHQQLQMGEQHLQQWVREANALGDELDDLSGNASHRDLVRVRSRIDRLRNQLNAGITIRTVSSRYRLRTWQHRLSTIEHLLAYGEPRL